ncbi:MAG: phosphoglucosamine mutase [Methanolinea sp.]|nr:phosphoglucosamine mutase [Methanolinea sp.]
MEQKKLEKRLFGTNGVRGVVGKDMTPALALSIGMALGTMRQGTIAVGRDTRTSGPSLASALKAGLLAAGCDVVDLGILPTPALQFIVREHFDAGAVITASHNPPEYNGVKVVEPDGTEMGDEQSIVLEGHIFKGDSHFASWDRVGRERDAPSMVDEYVNSVVDSFPSDTGKGFLVVADPGCGAAAWTTPEILSRMGCRVFSLNSQMDGTFPGRLPEPSPEGLAPLADLVKATGARFGVAHDGDADRAVFIDDRGRFLEENRQFGLIADFICRERKGVIVTPVSTSRIIEVIAERRGCTVCYTPVGSIYVARTMIDLAHNGTEVAFGGEGNGGLIYPKHQLCRDGGMTAATMVALLASSSQPLSSLVDALPHFYMIKEKIREKDAAGLIERLKKAFSGESLDCTDGIRINREDSWALVRPSGTEPLVRVMVESAFEERATQFYDEIKHHFRD